MSYPPTLKQELIKYGATPTGNAEWDKEILHSYRCGRANEIVALDSFAKIVMRATDDITKSKIHYHDLSDPEIYSAHSKLVMFIADNIVLAPQRRKFIVDENNQNELRFLLYYFNDCPLAEEVFPDRGYKLHKNILLYGSVGVGKTMMMQVFSEYLKRTNNPRFFYNVSVTQMVNYYSVYNNIDRFLYNEKEGRGGFQGQPMNICLNDIGVDNRPFYGVDTQTIVSDLLHARNEIWANFSEYDRKFAHLTTNLTIDQLKKKFSHKDEYGRVVDRFKTYNAIPISGKSRR